MYLIDTNVISELRKQARADPNVKKWSRQVDPLTLFISVVTVFELEHGVLLIERRDPAQGRHLRCWLDDQVMPFFSGRVLSFDEADARRCAALHVPDAHPYRDAMLAATAAGRNLVLVTRNVKDFDGTGIALLNPWESAR